MLKLYNTLSRSIEEFRPEDTKKITMYSCGPTVYDNAHIGHMRKYTMDDILIRVLEMNGYPVHHVMNITDVGHLVSDEDTGEDKMEKGARKYGLSVWDIAKKFEKQFFDSTDAVGIKRPQDVMNATEYIKEQIELIKVLEEKGYTYTIGGDGIYFDTSKFPHYFDLSRQNPEELKKGARVAFVEGKKNISDFALWKFSPTNEPAEGESRQKRQMEWESPWGMGFPGWHIECSAMSLRAFTDFFTTKKQIKTIDIHTGGIDHIPVHHSNEIAQSEAATDKKFVNYWVHYNFLIVDSEKMSKSIGNIYTVQDIIAKGYDPLSLRYVYLQTHYKQEMNFTWESLDAAQTAYHKLIKEAKSWEKIGEVNNDFLRKFQDSLNEDINTAKALSIVWELVKTNIPSGDKTVTLMEMDSVLGLNVFERELEEDKPLALPAEVRNLIDTRETLRKAGDFAASDEIRDKIRELGYEVEDTKNGYSITKK